LNILLIWDEEELPELTIGKVVLWRSFSDGVSPNIVSIPTLVEKNADALKQRYLAWIYTLGEAKIQGRRLVDHLEIRPGFSYWWMTLFSEKCNLAKSSQIDNAIKLMAFESWVDGQSFSRVSMVSSNAPLAECIRSWCVSAGVAFEWQRLPVITERGPWFKRVYGSFPYALQALVWLTLYLIERWPLKGVGLRDWRQSEGQVTFVSYLFNLVADPARVGQFKSRYWADLPDELLREECKVNWLHLYVKDPLMHGKKAADLIRGFNSTGQGGQVHVTLDTFLGWRIVFNAMRDWLHVHRIGIKFQHSTAAECSSAIQLWPLLKDDWYRSFAGKEGLRNVLDVNLFESALKVLPTQRVGVYLQENMSWEFALINAWRSAGHKRLIGTAHSTVRFWDLRYFFDLRSYVRTDKNDLPLPDNVALNGEAMMKTYLAGGYPSRELVEVEALRYLHLVQTLGEKGSTLNMSKPLLSVLVAGDFLFRNTKLQMSLLEKAARLLPENMRIIVKPHPLCPIFAEDYPSLDMEVSEESIANLLQSSDVVYASSITSAAVDAYCAGVPVVCLLDLNTLNMSPLRGRPGALFASSPEELASKLLFAAGAPPFTEQREDFFTLDLKLPRWRALLLDSPAHDTVHSTHKDTFIDTEFNLLLD
jgi:surface carbohydrate biosynthesis protein (TIGR04326 family)